MKEDSPYVLWPYPWVVISSEPRRDEVMGNLSPGSSTPGLSTPEPNGLPGSTSTSILLYIIGFQLYNYISKAITAK